MPQDTDFNSPYDERTGRAELDTLIDELRGLLPSTLDGRQISACAKTPYKAALIDAAMLYRTIALADAVRTLCDKEQYLAAAIVSRAVVENSGLLMYVALQIDKVTQSGSLGDIDDLLMQGVVGNKIFEEKDFTPIHVLKALDHTEKVLPGIRHSYDIFCEIAHPNWMGSHQVFAEHNETGSAVRFNLDSPPGISFMDVLPGLCAAIQVVILAHRKLNKILPDFVGVCERDIKEHME